MFVAVFEKRDKHSICTALPPIDRRDAYEWVQDCVPREDDFLAHRDMFRNWLSGFFTYERPCNLGPLDLIFSLPHLPLATDAHRALAADTLRFLAFLERERGKRIESPRVRLRVEAFLHAWNPAAARAGESRISVPCRHCDARVWMDAPAFARFGLQRCPEPVGKLWRSELLASPNTQFVRFVAERTEKLFEGNIIVPPWVVEWVPKALLARVDRVRFRGVATNRYAILLLWAHRALQRREFPNVLSMRSFIDSYDETYRPYALGLLRRLANIFFTRGNRANAVSGRTRFHARRATRATLRRVRFRRDLQLARPGQYEFVLK